MAGVTSGRASSFFAIGRGVNVILCRGAVEDDDSAFNPDDGSPSGQSARSCALGMKTS